MQTKHLYWILISLAFSTLNFTFIEEGAMLCQIENPNPQPFLADTIRYSLDPCTQELGNEIFVPAGFGADWANSWPDDPGYAPGHTYVSGPAPIDGEYTVTNSTIDWDGFAEIVWIDILDNGPEDNGYMVVVNMHPDGGVVFNHQFQNLCTNTRYQLSVDLINLMKPIIDWGIIPDVDLMLNDQVVMNTGLIPQDSAWHNFEFSFWTDDTTTEVEFKIREDEGGILGRDIAIDNLVVKPCLPTLDVVSSHDQLLCLGETLVLYADFESSYDTTYIEWQHSTDNGFTWNPISTEQTFIVNNPTEQHAGMYRFVVAGSIINLESFGCNVLSDPMNLDFSSPVQTTFNPVLCEGETFTVGTSVYDSTGNYQDIFLAENGCDSTVFTNLVIVDPVIDTQELKICFGENYNGININMDTLVVVEACDSTIITQINLFPTYRDTQEIYLCEGSIYEGITYYQDSTLVFDYQSINGCDSTIVLEVMLNADFEMTEEVLLCEGELWEGLLIANDTMIIDSLFSQNGCDSVITTNISIAPIYNDSLNYQLCEGELYDGQLFLNDTILIDSLSSSFGCDSVTVHTIEIFPVYLDTLDITICEGDEYNGFILHQDTIITDSLMSQYTCDSVIVSDITVLPTYHDTIHVDICETSSQFGPESYEGRFTEQSGDTIYIDTLQTVAGCDSLISTYIHVFFHETEVQAVQLCPGDVLTVGENEYDRAGIYRDTLLTGQLCDSVIISFVSISNVIEDTIYVPLCRDVPYQGILYENDTTLIRNVNDITDCDSIIYTLIDIQEHVSDSVEVDLCYGDIYNEQFFTNDTIYIDSLYTIHGCDSIVKQKITVFPEYSFLDTIYLGESQMYNGINYPNDTLLMDSLLTVNTCDSILNTQLIILPSVYQIDTTDLCTNQNYNGTFYSNDTLLTDTLMAVNGADSILLNYLEVHPIYSIDTEASICQNDSIFLAGAFQNEDGVYTDSYLSEDGCDSLVHTTLTVHPVWEVDLDQDVCSGDSYEGIQLFSDTILQNIHSTYQGCDSIINVHITIRDNYQFLDTIYINEGTPYNGITILNDSLLQEDLLTQYNCDSILQTQIIIRPPVITNDTLQICGGEYQGTTYTQNTLLTENHTAHSGADSIYQLYLIPINEYLENQVRTICEGESAFLQGDYQTIEDLYFDTLISSTGCDSVIVTNLIVLEVPKENQDIYICEGDSIYLQGAYQYNAGTYIDTLTAHTGCDSILTTQLYIDNSITTIIDTTLCEGDSYLDIVYTQDSNFIEILDRTNGCDSIVITTIDVAYPQYTYEEVYITIGEEYMGEAFQADTLLSESGLSFYGCDSLSEIQIYVLPNYNTDRYFNLCPGTIFGGEPLMNDTTVVDSFLSIHLTDSIFFTHYILSPTDTVHLFQTNCDITNDTIIYHTDTNQYGCDSINILHLEPAISYMIDSLANICEGDIYNGFYFENDTLIIDQHYTLEGCDSTVITQINVHPNPITEIQGDEDLECAEENILLYVEEEGSYQWSNGMTENEITIYESGIYSVTITNENGCSTTDAINIQIPESIEVQYRIKEPSCITDGLGSFTIESISGGVPPYLCNINYEAFHEIKETETHLSAGAHYISIQDANGCLKDTMIVFDEVVNPTFSLEAEQELFEGDSTQILVNHDFTIENIQHIEWYPTTGLSCANCFEPMATPTYSTDYTLTIETTEGCVYTEHILLKVSTNYNVFVPSAFSPNDDYLNDELMVYAGENVEEIISFNIFDRWGNQLFVQNNFQANDPSFGWDGFYKNKKMTQGVYVYFLEARLKNNDIITKKGDFTIIY